MNIYSMLADPIRRLSGRTAVSWGERSVTYDGLDRTAATIGAHYAALGSKRGDRVLLFLKNGFHYPALMLAAFRAGMVAVPVNAKLHPCEVAWIAGDSQPKVIVTHAECEGPLREALPEGVEPRFVIVEEFEPQPREGALPPPAEVEPDDPAWIFYTSGTTGKPKGATLTHRNLVAATTNCLADMFDFRERDRVLHVAPLSHGSGLYLIPSLARGAENILSDRPGFQPDEVFDMVAARSITAIAFVAPTMIVRMLEVAPP